MCIAALLFAAISAISHFLPGFGLGAAVYGFFAFPVIALVFEYSTQQFPEVPLNITNSIFSCFGQMLGSIVQM